MPKENYWGGDKKPFYLSREFWVAMIGSLAPIIAHQFGYTIPPEMYPYYAQIIIGIMLALRLFATKTNLTLK